MAASAASSSVAPQSPPSCQVPKAIRETLSSLRPNLISCISSLLQNSITDGSSRYSCTLEPHGVGSYSQLQETRQAARSSHREGDSQIGQPSRDKDGSPRHDP